MTAKKSKKIQRNILSAILDLSLNSKIHLKELFLRFYSTLIFIFYDYFFVLFLQIYSVRVKKSRKKVKNLYASATSLVMMLFIFYRIRVF